MASGKAAVIASGKPFSPSTTAMRMSWNEPSNAIGPREMANAVLEFVHHRQPEFGTLVLSDPEPQNLADAVPGDAQGHIDCLVLDHAAVRIADFDPQSVENDDRIHPVQRPALPFPDVLRLQTVLWTV